MRNFGKRKEFGSVMVLMSLFLSLVLVILLVLILFKLEKNKSGNNTASSSVQKSYCSSIGKVCLSYPYNWSLSYYESGVQITNPATQTTVVYKPENVPATVSCAQGACEFTTLSAVISDGFSNANDMAGVFYNTQTNSYVPEYFLMSTNQVLNYGLRLNNKVDIKQIVNPVFVNNAVGNLEQQLKILPGSNLTFNSQSSAENWLHTSDAKLAEAIINSAKLD